MKPVFQTIRHDPENGKYGDCFRAAIASLLELSIEEVPHFYDGNKYGENDEKIYKFVQDWLGERGHYHVTILFEGDPRQAMKEWNPEMYYILSGQSSAGNHCVVAYEDEIVHDPANRESPYLIGPMDHGYWQVELLASSIMRKEKDDGIKS